MTTPSPTHQVTFRDYTPLGATEPTGYSLLLDGTVIGHVVKTRSSYDANHLNGGRCGNARMVKSTYWQTTSTARTGSTGFRSRQRPPTRVEAFTNLLNEVLPTIPWSDLRALAKSARRTPAPTQPSATPQPSA